MIRQGFLTGPVLGGLWMVVLSVTVAVAMSFATGEAFRPNMWLSLFWGGLWCGDGGFGAQSAYSSWDFRRFGCRHLIGDWTCFGWS